MQYRDQVQKDIRWIYENKVYYSSIAKENDDAKDEVIYSEKVDGPFVCCNIQEFSEIMQNIEPKTASRE